MRDVFVLIYTPVKYESKSTSLLLEVRKYNLPPLRRYYVIGAIYCDDVGI